MSRSRGSEHLDDEYEDDTPPWLAPAEPEVRRARSRAPGREPPTVVPRSRALFWGAVLAGLLLVVAALVYALVAKPAADADMLAVVDGEVPLIRAPDTPYKSAPADAGGAVDGEGLTAYEAAGGVDPGGELALDAMPEEPLPLPAVTALDTAPPAAGAATASTPVVTGTSSSAAKPSQSTKPAAAAQPAAVAPQPSPQPKAGDRLAELDKELSSATIPKADTGQFALQLGAFSTNAKANEVWKSFAGRYAYLSGLDKSIGVVERDGKTLYRLRATGLTSRRTAENLCARLKVAGESCTVAE